MKHKNDLTFNAKFNGKERFGFRKLSIGLVTAALGTTFFLSNGQLVHADVNTSSQQSTSTEKVEEKHQSEETVKANNEEIKTKETTLNQQNITNKSSDTSETSGTHQNNTPKTNNGTTQGNVSEENSSTETNSSIKTSQLDTSSLETHNVKGVTLREEKINETQDPKAQSSSTIVTATKDGQNVTGKTLTQKIYTADQDTFKVRVDIDNLKDDATKPTANNPITIQIFNEDPKGSITSLRTTDTVNGHNGWEFSKSQDSSSPNTFKAWYKGSGTPTSTYLTVDVQASNEDVKKYLKDNSKSSETIPVGVKITYPTGTSETKSAFTASFIPSKDKIEKYELLKGFKMTETTVDSEAIFGNISPANKEKYKDSKVLQWGLYFNYNGSLNKVTLENAIFSATFNNQTLLPESIKVFEVPTEYVSDGNGNHYGINDIPADQEKLPTKEQQNVYHLITKS